MNNKGFTLIELLAVILLLALITAVAFPMVGNMLESSKKSSYKILLNNIKSAAGTYLEECMYGDTTISCPTDVKTTKTASITLKELVEYGFMNSTEKKCDNSNCIKNPNNNQELGGCTIKIELNSTKYKITNVISPPGITCPSKSKLNNPNA